MNREEMIQFVKDIPEDLIGGISIEIGKNGPVIQNEYRAHIVRNYPGGKVQEGGYYNVTYKIGNRLTTLVFG